MSSVPTTTRITGVMFSQATDTMVAEPPREEEGFSISREGEGFSITREVEEFSIAREEEGFSTRVAVFTSIRPEGGTVGVV